MTELYTIPQWILFFYIYCFLGWVWESAYVSVCERKLVNRGFLKGPFLPIYGSGAICILAVTIPVRGNIPLMFLVGMVSATLLEYVTGAVMERLFRVRYWDYSNKFLNINGYVCLMSALCWGVMTILMVEVIQVHVEPFVLRLGAKICRLLVMVITPYFVADFVTSFIAAIHLRDALIRNDRIKEELAKLNARKTVLEEELQSLGENLLEAGGKTYAQVLDKLQEAGENLPGAKTYAQVKDKLQEAGESLPGAKTYAQIREKLQGAGVNLSEAGGKTYAQVLDKLQGAGEKTYGQLREELQEIYLKTGEYKEKLHLAYTKSTRGLLKRNPHAVSRIHRESFSELKKDLMEKLEEIRR